MITARHTHWLIQAQILVVVVFPSCADYCETLHDNCSSSSPYLLFHRKLQSSGGILVLNLEGAGLKPPSTDGYSGLVAPEKKANCNMTAS